MASKWLSLWILTLMGASQLVILKAASSNIQRQHHVSTILNVKYPKGLRLAANEDSGGYDHTDALFGVPFLKDRLISGHLFYMTPDMTKSKGNKNGCETYSIDVDSSDSREGIGSIYMVDRGGCSFTDKTSLAQSEGADGLLVTSDECLESDIKALEKLELEAEDIFNICCKQAFVNKDSDLCSGDKSDVKEMEEAAFDYLPFMVSGISANQALTITIPAMLVSLTESLKMKFCLCEHQSSLSSTKFCKDASNKKNVLKSLKDKLKLDCKSPDKVIVEMQLDTPHPSGEVKYELWIKPDAQPAMLKHFDWFSQSLKDKTHFQPQYIVHQAIQCSYSNDDTEDICKSYCKTLNNGEKLCYLPESLNGLITGIDMLDEIVRQYCIYDQGDFSKDGLKFWWDYQRLFREEECIRKSERSSFESCSKEIVSSFRSDFKLSDWESCVENEYDNILSKLNERQQEIGIFTTAAVVNSRIMHFSLAADEVAERVCDGFAQEKVPHVCACVSKALNENEFNLCKACLETKNCETIIDSEQRKRNGEEDSPASNRSLVMVILILTGLVGAAFLYTKQTRMTMRSELRGLMQEYMPLDESNLGGSHFERMLGSESRGHGNDREDSNLI